MRFQLISIITVFGFLSFFASFGLTEGSSAPLRFRLAADPRTLDWNLASSTHETYVIMNLMEGLVEESQDLKPQAALAERWEISPDGRSYTFYIRPGIAWTDGRALTASDFEESWFRLLDPKTKAEYASFLFDVENAEEYHAGKIKDRSKVGIKATGRLKFEVRLKRRVPYFLHLTTFWVTFPIRADLIRKYGAKWATPGKIVTLGPYLLKEWQPGKMIRMVRNPKYYNAGKEFAAVPQEIEAWVEANDAKARELFEQGKLDFLLNATTQDLLRSRGQGGGKRAQQFPYLATYYLGFNVTSGPLKDPSIRRALALALDRNAIPGLLQGGQTTAQSLIPPGIDGHSSAPRFEGSLYDAKAALSKAGYVEGQGFPKLVFWIQKFDGAESLGKFVADTFKQKLGISVEVRSEKSGEGIKDSRSGASAFLARWGADYPDAESFLQLFGSKSGNNKTGWKNAEYDRILEKAGQTADAGERLVAYAQAERLLIDEECVIIPLFYQKNAVLLGSRVRQFEISPLNYLFFKTIKLAD